MVLNPIPWPDTAALGHRLAQLFHKPSPDTRCPRCHRPLLVDPCRRICTIWRRGIPISCRPPTPDLQQVTGTGTFNQVLTAYP